MYALLCSSGADTMRWAVVVPPGVRSRFATIAVAARCFAPRGGWRISLDEHLGDGILRHRHRLLHASGLMDG